MFLWGHDVADVQINSKQLRVLLAQDQGSQNSSMNEEEPPEAPTDGCERRGLIYLWACGCWRVARVPAGVFTHAQMLSSNWTQQAINNIF